MKPACVAGLIALSTAGAAFAAGPIPGCVANRIVPFDTFMQGQLVSVPLSIPVPKAYEPVTAEEMMHLTYSYWMPRKEVKQSLKSHKLPEQTGYMYGKLSLNVAYEPELDSFSIHDEEFAASGQRVLGKEQISVNGHSLLFMEVAVKVQNVERKVWMLYIAMNIDTNAAYFTYVPPRHDEALGDCFWKHLKEVAKASQN